MKKTRTCLIFTSIKTSTVGRTSMHCQLRAKRIEQNVAVDSQCDASEYGLQCQERQLRPIQTHTCGKWSNLQPRRWSDSPPRPCQRTQTPLGSHVSEQQPRIDGSTRPNIAKCHSSRQGRLWEEGWRRVPGLGRAPPPAKHGGGGGGSATKELVHELSGTRAILAKKPEAPLKPACLAGKYDLARGSRARLATKTHEPSGGADTPAETTPHPGSCVFFQPSITLCQQTLLQLSQPSRTNHAPPTPSGNFQLLVKASLTGWKTLHSGRSLTWSRREGEK